MSKSNPNPDLLRNLQASQDEVARLEAENTERRRLLASKRDEVIHHACDFVESFYRAELVRARDGNPNRFKALPAEKIKEMKDSINELVRNARDRTRVPLEGSKMWAHGVDLHRAIDATEGYNVAEAFSTAFEEELRYILGDFGKIFIKYIFADENLPKYGSWEKKSSTVRYSSGLGMSDALKRSIDDYKGQIRGLFKSAESLQIARTNLSRIEAEKIWEDA